MYYHVFIYIYIYIHTYIHTSFYVSFWDPGRMYIETRMIERNFCKFNYSTRNYRTELVNARKMGKAQLWNTNKNYRTTNKLGVS